VIALNKLNTIKILKQFKAKYSSTLIKLQDVNTSYYMMYAALLEPNELKNDTDSMVETVIDYIFSEIIYAFESPSLYSKTYHVTELLVLLSKLVVNDKCIQYILNQTKINAYDYFMEKFIQYNKIKIVDELIELICLTLFNIFWSISFQNGYDKKLKVNIQFVDIVQVNQNNTILGVKNAAKGILSNLDINQNLITSNIVSSIDENDMSIMVSYSHQDRDFCQKLVSNLKEKISNVWVDYERLKSNEGWEDVANAITQAKIILIIATQNYCASNSCRQEAIYAYTQGKIIIPLFLSRDYQPEKWLAIRIENVAYIRFNTDLFEKTFSKLVDLIFMSEKKRSTDKLKLNHAVISTKPIALTLINEKILSKKEINVQQVSLEHTASFLSSSSHLTNKSVHNWTFDDVKQWFRQENLPTSLCSLFSFKNVIYAKLLLNDKSKIHKEYDILSSRLYREPFYWDHYSNFISSLENLIQRKSIYSWTPNDIQQWFNEQNLPSYLCSMYSFSNGKSLVTYAQLLMKVEVDNEYNRLKKRVKSEYNKQFYPDEYAKLFTAMTSLVNNTKNEIRREEQFRQDNGIQSCRIL
ncbi:unnamed protein product, partial [Didymodactylos carnosus]